MSPVSFIDEPVYGWSAGRKRPWLLEQLNQLTRNHLERCTDYRRLMDSVEGGRHAQTLADLYPLSVRLFKQNRLLSIDDDEVFRVLTSSGTTSQQVSRIYLDRETAALQSKALVKIMQPWLGRQRLPMLIIDHPGVITERSSFSARGAGIQGMMVFGRRPVYALNADLSPNWGAIDEFVESHRGQPILLFGFTFMVWQLLQALNEEGRSLALHDGVLVHSGGWKKLQDQAVDNATFKARSQHLFGVDRVHNFYGMVEQVGSVFVECERGHLHTPLFADLLIRDAQTGNLKPNGETGIIEVLSVLPRSYPGHVLLTEDRGRILGEDDCACGRMGKYFEVLGRVPRAEVRGCSDTVEPSKAEEY
ncbi:acyl-protein synthetase [Marinobacterium zhoushanense]|uniref:Acyl-protein synthetase n=1 Tax=Marinobacterium zhoushanense TaxID=1679163 RepID=A0ABQ1KQB3_9GAMM|nr:acyl-protein synthetase [Marinobacterium zhoushanense]GGC07610.1 acyl-protein synthetase [Marinobacterium zhoushanense]